MRPVRLVAALAVLGCACSGTPPQGSVGTADRGTVTISIVGTNDLHGGVLQREDRGGLALLGGYVANLRAARSRDGGATLLIDAGDMFQGTLESNLNEGAAVIAAYNTLGYTAAAVGNHDFDFGPVGPGSVSNDGRDDRRGALQARATEASFPLLAANIVERATGRLVGGPNIRPTTLVTAAGVRVGIIGVMTERALSQTIAANVADLRVTPLAPAIEAAAAELRTQGAAVVIVTAHAGGRCTEFSNPADLTSCDQNAEIVRVARALSRGAVDVIISGHAHAGMAHSINDVAITEAYLGGRAFGRVDLVIDRNTARVVDRRIFAPRDLCARVDPGTTRCDPGSASDQRVAAEYEGAPVTPDPAIARILQPAVNAALAQKKMPLGITLSTPIRRAGTGDSPLGNLFADAYRAAVPKADVAVNNTSGGLRADLPAGPLTYGAVFEVMPFDNRLVAFHLTGGELRKMLGAQLAHSAALVGVSGVRVRVACQGNALDLVLLRPSGAPVTDNERLLVATTDFLATGGDDIFDPVTPPGGFDAEFDGGYVRDVVIAALQKRGGTLDEEQLIDAANPRWVVPARPPIRCGG